MFLKNRTDYDYVFKLLLIGDSGTGKSSLLLRFTTNDFNNQHLATIGVDFRIKTIYVNNRVIKLQIWDTAGLERFRTITNAYYRNVDGIIIVYDITNRMTFMHVENWVRESDIHGPSTKFKLIVGNKSDLVNQRQVSCEEGSNLSESLRIPIIETSAKSGSRVHEMFYDITDEILNKVCASMSFDEKVEDLQGERRKVGWMKKCFQPDCC